MTPEQQAKRARAWKTVQQIAMRVNRAQKNDPGKTALDALKAERATWPEYKPQKRTNNPLRLTVPRPRVTVLAKLSRIEDFLIKHWAKPIDGQPAFCTLTDVELFRKVEDWLKKHHKGSVTEASLRKTRQRLGLGK